MLDCKLVIRVPSACIAFEATALAEDVAEAAAVDADYTLDYKVVIDDYKVVTDDYWLLTYPCRVVTDDCKVPVVDCNVFSRVSEFSELFLDISFFNKFNY